MGNLEDGVGELQVLSLLVKDALFVSTDSVQFIEVGDDFSRSLVPSSVVPEMEIRVLKEGVEMDRDSRPLKSLLPCQLAVSDRVIKKALEIQHYVGIECQGSNEQFLALLMAIEGGHAQLKNSDSKKQRELKRLSCSINYEGSSSKERSKGRWSIFSP